MMILEQSIEDFIDEVCDILDIDPPEIVIDESVMRTKTTKMQLHSSGERLYIQGYESTFDFYFSLAHELRHVWQIRKKPSLLKDYKQPGDLSMEQYNLQPAEVDAHAFAELVMIEFFRVTPQYENFSAKVKDTIREHKHNIIAELML